MGVGPMGFGGNLDFFDGGLDALGGDPSAAASTTNSIPPPSSSSSSSLALHNSSVVDGLMRNGHDHVAQLSFPETLSSSPASSSSSSVATKLPSSVMDTANNSSSSASAGSKSIDIYVSEKAVKICDLDQIFDSEGEEDQSMVSVNRLPYSGYFSRGGNFRDIRGRLISANIKLAKNYTGEIFNPLITTPAYSSATTCYGVAAVLCQKTSCQIPKGHSPLFCLLLLSLLPTRASKSSQWMRRSEVHTIDYLTKNVPR